MAKKPDPRKPHEQPQDEPLQVEPLEVADEALLDEEAAFAELMAEANAVLDEVSSSSEVELPGEATIASDPVVEGSSAWEWAAPPADDDAVPIAEAVGAAERADEPLPLPPMIPAEVEEVDILEEAIEGLEPASEVHLGDPAVARPEPPSGESSFEWADNLPGQSPSSGNAAPAQFDSPSDVDVLEAALAEEIREAGLSEPLSNEDALSATLKHVGGMPESSHVNLTDPPPSDDPLKSRHLPPARVEGDSSFDQPIAAIPIRRVPGESDVLLGSRGEELESLEEVILPEDAVDSSRVNLSEPTLDLEAMEARLEQESGLDLGAAEVVDVLVPPQVESGLNLGDPLPSLFEEEAAVLGADGVDLAAPVPEVSLADSASGLDLGASPIVEIVDSSSGLELAGAEVIEEDASASGAMPRPSSESDIFVGADETGEDVGGAVLLDSPSGVDLELAGAAIVEDADGAGSDLLELAAPPLEGPSESAVNLGLGGAEKGSSRDLIAEAVESGVDLAGGALVEDVSAGEPLEEEVILAGVEPLSPESSAVDLGASPVLVMEDEEQGAALVDDLDLEQYAAQEVVEEAAVDDELTGTVSLEEEGVEAAVMDDGAPTPGSGNVELGQPMPASEDSDQGTLEDPEGAVDDFLSGMDMSSTEPVEGSDVEGQVMAEPDTGETLLDERSGIEDEEITAESEREEGEAEPAEEGEAEAAEEAEEEEERERPAPKPRYFRRWVGGTLLGGVTATAACVGLLVFSPELTKPVLDEVNSLAEQAGLKEPVKKVDVGKDTGPKDLRPQQPKEDVRDLLVKADWSKENPEIDQQNGDQRAARGEYLWMQFLSQAKQPLAFKIDDPKIKAVLADLDAAEQGAGTSQKAKANALYWKGHIEETLNNRPAAETIYKKGLNDYRADDSLRILFESALNRLEALSPAKAPEPPKGAGARGQTIDFFPPALVLVPAQMGGGAPAPQQDPEAGPDFWEAVTLAGKQKYAEAIKKLDDARAKHDARRLRQIGKPQNPMSDRTEAIFLKSCDELKIYWQMRETLMKDKEYAAAGDPMKGLQAVLNKITTAAKDLDDEKKKYADLDTMKKEVDTKLADLEKAHRELKTTFANADKALKESAEALKKEKEKLAAAEALVRTADARVKKVDDEKKELADMLTEVGDKIGLRGIDPVKSRKALFQSLADLVRIEKTNDPTGELRSHMVQVRDLKATLEQRWSPETMLGYWLPLLADRERKELIDAALRDAGLVKASQPTAEARGHALTVEGLALRNKGEYDKAREALTEAVRGDLPGAHWKKTAKDTLEELTTTNEYLRRANELRAAHQYDRAVEVLTEGLQVFPLQKGELLALRGLVRLEKALMEKERVAADTPGIKEAGDDAAAAIRAGAVGNGAYLSGRLEEELGQLDKAMTLYEDAIKNLKDGENDIERTRLALARVKLRRYQTIPVKPAPSRPMDALKVGRLLLPSPRELVAQLPPVEEEKAIKEAQDLARQVLSRMDIDQYPLLKARAQATLGQWTQALNTYVEGLKPHLSRERHEGLKFIVENHPIQRQPVAELVPHPREAEKRYAQGLTRFFARDFATAEKDFRRAIEHFNGDARYHYYLGLTQLAQGKQGARENFDQGARLEFDNRPTAGAVNAALERIQGEPRRLINEARERVR